MEQLLFSPPVALVIFIFLGLALSQAVSGYAATGELNERKFESYACGQRQVRHSVSPDYSQFFPYAFFFTIMHVLVLVIASAPRNAVVLPLLYVGCGILALTIIFRR